MLLAAPEKAEPARRQSWVDVQSDDVSPIASFAKHGKVDERVQGLE